MESVINLIPEKKLKQIIQESVEHSEISLLLYDKSGELIIQYPSEPQQAFDAKELFTQIADTDETVSTRTCDTVSDSLSLFSEPVLHKNELIAFLVAISPNNERCTVDILHLTRHRIEDLIVLNEELKSLSSEIIHNYDELNLLYTLSEMLAGISDIKEASSKIIENAIDVIEADCGSVLLADRDKEELQFTYTNGKPSPSVRIKFGQGVCGLVAMKQNSILVESPDNLPQESDGPLSFSPPLIASPMIVKGELIGVIILTRKSADNFFTAMDLKLLEAIASQAAVAFMNVRLFNDLMKSNQKLKDTLQHLQTAQEQLIQSQRLAAMGQLIASVAHDINNPLTSIMGYSELLLMNQEIDGELRKRLEIIHKESQRAASIVRSLKTFAKKRVHEQKQVNINSIIQETLPLLEKKLAMKNIQISNDLDPRLPITMADPGQIQQILVNFLINAEEAINDSGKIEIKTEVVNGKLSEKPRIRFSVSDNGRGIPKEIKARIFEPFFTTKDEVKGTGLGLSICHGIVSAHEGEIYVESECGKGTTFFVELPIVKQDVDSKTTFDFPFESSFTQTTKKNILIVDDELFIQDLLKSILSDEGYSVDIASDGKEALRKLEQRQYDLFLIDIVMPNIDGIQLYNRIQQEFPHVEIKDKVIFVTGDTFREETETFLKQCKEDYISKPFIQEDLCRKVGELLNN